MALLGAASAGDGSTGRQVGALDNDRDHGRAVGVPIVVDGAPVAVICPVASRVGKDRAIQRRLAGLTVTVATRGEQERLAKVCAPGRGLRVVEVRPWPASSPQPTRYGSGSINVGQPPWPACGAGSPEPIGRS